MDAGGGGKTGAGGSAGGGGAGTTGGRGGATGGQAGASAGTNGTAGSAAGGGGTAGGGATAGTGGATGTAGASAGTTGAGGVAGASGGAGGAGAAGSGGGRGGSGGSGRGGAGGQAGATCAIAATGEMVMSLAGTWTFTPSGAAATTITVPGGGWVAQGFRSTNEANYQRMAMVPNLGRAQATYLEFGAINHQATLTVDSTMVGTQTTSFTPSVWDVTSVVKPGMSHSFTVDVKGRNALKGSSGKKLVPDAAGWSGNVAQGIFRSAILHVVPALHVFETLVRTDVAADQFSIDVWVKNDGASAATGTVDVGLSSWTCDGTTYPSVPSKSVSVPAGQTVKVTLGPITWGLGATSYWWPNVPYVQGYRAKLHVARVTVTPDAAGGGAAAAHSIPVRFGFRQSRQVTAHYELNGVPIKFRGDNVQGADYDSIKTAGAKDNSDAYDLFPGFLPPSANNPGWPQAVDNWQRLNFNVARLHQEPVSPYMLDVMDEMGMMVIDESAIRGSNNDQDFMAGSANMIAHLNALVHRDRNHPCVIRWSQCNEPEGDSTNSSAFQQQLYQTVVAADDTRPVSADPSGSGPTIINAYGVTAANFTVFEHYSSGFGTYTHDVAVSTTHPYGVGEFIWPADNSAQGLMWFATSTVTLAPEGPIGHSPLHAAFGVGQLRARREGKHDDHRTGWAAAVHRGQPAHALVEPDHHARSAGVQSGRRHRHGLLGRQSRVRQVRGVVHLEAGHQQRRAGQPAADGVQRHPVRHRGGRRLGDAPGHSDRRDVRSGNHAPRHTPGRPRDRHRHGDRPRLRHHRRPHSAIQQERPGDLPRRRPGLHP